MYNEFEIEQDHSLVVARLLCPQLSVTIAEALFEELRTRMRFDGALNFILDLTEVRFLSSACLGMLVEMLQDLDAVKGRIALAGCCADVAFLFKVTRLDAVFNLYEDVPDARAAFGDRTHLTGPRRG